METSCPILLSCLLSSNESIGKLCLDLQAEQGDGFTDRSPILSDPELVILKFRQDSIMFIKTEQVLPTLAGPIIEMLVQYSKCKTLRLLNQHFEKLIKCQVSF